MSRKKPAYVHVNVRVLTSVVIIFLNAAVIIFVKVESLFVGEISDFGGVIRGRGG